MSDFYPDVRHGDDVIFSTDPNAPIHSWRYAKVRIPKTDSADLVVFSEQGVEYRHDCLYVTDPKCKLTRIWAESGRGVFVLVPREVELRQDRIDRIADTNRMFNIERKLKRIEDTIEGIASRSGGQNAAEQKSRPSSSARQTTVQS